MAADLVTSINWPGSSSFSTGSTPFGLYDSESLFQQHADKVGDWVAKRLGYPVQNVELLPENIYACFEESISEYSAQVNAFNIRNNLYNMLGQQQNENTNHTGDYIEGANTNQIITIANSYGVEANVGGKRGATVHKGSLRLINGVQRYDLSSLSEVSQSFVESTGGARLATIPSGSLESGSHYGEDIIITRVFYEGVPAISGIETAITGIETSITGIEGQVTAVEGSISTIQFVELPLLGSVKPYAPFHSPLASLGMYFCFCSSVPKYSKNIDNLLADYKTKNPSREKKGATERVAKLLAEKTNQPITSFSSRKPKPAMSVMADTKAPMVETKTPKYKG